MNRRMSKAGLRGLVAALERNRSLLLGENTKLKSQLAGESRQVDRLWDAVDKYQELYHDAVGDRKDWQAEASLANDRANAAFEELAATKALWHPPSIEEAFEFARKMENPDYKPIPREINWAPAPLHSATVVSAQPLGEHPPIDDMVSVGSIGMDETPIANSPNPLAPDDAFPVHAGPGL